MFVLLALLSIAAQEPEDKPPLDTRGLVLRKEAASEGYTLIAPLSSKKTFLLGMDGEVAHEWDLESQTESAILLDDGTLLRWAITPEENERFQGPGVDGGILEKIDWEGNALWRYVLDYDRELLHHDIALLPNGNILFLAWQHRTREEAIAAGRDPRQVDERGMWPDVVYELRPTPPGGGEIVWRWSSWDHLVQDLDPSRRNYGSVPDHPGKVDVNADHRGMPPLTLEEIEAKRKLDREMASMGYGGSAQEEEEPRRSTAPDWLHTNAVDYLPEHDLIVLSVPTLSELWVIDHSTTTEEAAGTSGGRRGKGGEILWRWGNPRNYGAGTDADQQLSFQHDPTWLPSQGPNELRLLVFNNGRVRPGHTDPASFSSVDELVIPFDPARGFVRPPGKPYGPAGPAWSYSEPGVFYSSFISGAQRLPNGNTLICSGAQGRVFEVTPMSEIVWDYRNPHVGEIDHGIPANALYRAVRFPKGHPGLAAREL